MRMSPKRQLQLLWLFLVQTYLKISFFNRFIPGGIRSQMIITTTVLKRFIFAILSVGPIPNHIAFILDGNRRYAREKNLPLGGGHMVGFANLIRMLRYCYELGVKYVTIYAFGIDNFRRKPEIVQFLMEFMRVKIEELLLEESIINEYGIKLQFVGSLRLLPEDVRIAAEKAMRATAHNNQKVLLICVAYTSTDEIVHAVQESCRDKWNQLHKRAKNSKAMIGNMIYDNSNKYAEVSDGVQRCSDDEITSCSSEHDQTENHTIQLVDIEKHMYMSTAPDPDILIRTSGETRLSNFLLWQTDACLLYSPSVLWPEIGLRHLVWATLNFQRHYLYLEKKKKNK